MNKIYVIYIYPVDPVDPVDPVNPVKKMEISKPENNLINGNHASSTGP